MWRYAVLFVMLLGLIACSRTSEPNLETLENPEEFEPMPIATGLQRQSLLLADWAIEEGLAVEVLGVGLGTRFQAESQASLSIDNPENVVKLYVQVVFKAGQLSLPTLQFVAPNDIRVHSSSGEEQSLAAGGIGLADLVADNGTVLDNVGRVYEAIFAPAASLELTIDGIGRTNLRTPRAFIVYVFRETDAITDETTDSITNETANSLASGGSIGNYYLYGQAGYSSASKTIAIPPSDSLQDVEVLFSIAELGSDSRNVQLYAEAGGVQLQETVALPNEGDELLLHRLWLENVPPGTDHVVAEVRSTAAPRGQSLWLHGDSFFWHGVNVVARPKQFLNCPQGDVLYVNHSASGEADGSNWQDALPNLQDALQLAKQCESHQEIWVAQGTYYPDRGLLQTLGDREASFTLHNDLAVYGGFVGNEDNRDARDIEQHLTTLSGDINVSGDLQGNSYNVVVVSGTDNSAVLDGFTIMHGNGTYNPYACTTCRGGAGIHNTAGSPSLANLVIRDNQAANGGGMANFAESMPILTNVTFVGNDVRGYGGGMYNKDSNSTMHTVSFIGNRAGEAGAGIHGENSIITMNNATFSENIAQGIYASGGGISLSASSLVVNDATFSDNAAWSVHGSGGGIYAVHSSLNLDNVAFINNRTGNHGGGIHSGESDVTLNNASFNGNSATWRGGGMSSFGGSAVLREVVFVENTTNHNGGGFYNSNSIGAVTLSNVSFTGNAAKNYGGGIYNRTSFSGSDNLLTLNDVVFENNRAESNGGGMYSFGSKAILGDVLFTGNVASRGAGMYVSGGDSMYGYNLVLNNVSFHANRTLIYGRGGGMYNEDSSPELNDVRFTENYAGSAGGGIYNLRSFPTLNNVVLRDNEAYSYYMPNGAGGGMYNERSSPELNHVHFLGNKSFDSGGGMYNTNSHPTLRDVIFEENEARVDGGGGMYSYNSNPTLERVSFTANKASPGSGMMNEFSSPSLHEVTFTRNFNGGMYSMYGSSTLSHVTFSENNGGALIIFYGEHVLDHVVIRDNTSGDGGGIFNESGKLTLNAVEITGNVAGQRGGGIFVTNPDAELILTDVVISDNTAEHDGGGIASNGSIVTLNAVEITGNVSGQRGGGIFSGYGSVTLTASLIFGNEASNEGGGIYSSTANVVCTDTDIAANTLPQVFPASLETTGCIPTP